MEWYAMVCWAVLWYGGHSIGMSAECINQSISNMSFASLGQPIALHSQSVDASEWRARNQVIGGQSQAISRVTGDDGLSAVQLSIVSFESI